MFEMDPKNIQIIIDGKGTWSAIVRASRVKDVVADIAQSHQIKVQCESARQPTQRLVEYVFGIDC
jgi:hypothetical protein